MEEYCVDLEIAKELKENGFPQNSHFIHSKDRYGHIISTKIIGNPYSEKCINAPTSDEILKELPPLMYIWKCLDEYKIDYPDIEVMKDKKLSNALAKMYIYLKKEGYIK